MFLAHGYFEPLIVLFTEIPLDRTVASMSRPRTQLSTFACPGSFFPRFVAAAICLTAAATAFGVPRAKSTQTERRPAQAPTGWRVEVFSDQVKNATALCLDPHGNVYVCETYRWRKGIEDNRDHPYWIMDDLACQTVEDRARLYQRWQEKFQDPEYFTRYADRVVRLTDVDGDGRAEKFVEFAGGFHRDVDGPAIGLLWSRQGIYLTCIPDLWLLQDKEGDGRADTRTSLATGFGVKNSLSGHDLHGLTWGPDGKIYFSMGDRGFNVITQEGQRLTDPNSGAVFRCNPDGSRLEIFYHQLRNPQELAFNELGDLFTVDNNCDQGDSARVCYLLEGGNAGWHLGAQALTTYSEFIDDGGMEQAPHWLGEGLWKLRFPGQPAHILPPIAHLTNGPSGLVFDSGLSLAPRYRDHFLVCDYKGAPNLCFLYSFKVHSTGASYRMQDEQIVHGGIPNTDVDVGYDGKIYVTDFGGGWVRSDRGNIYTLYDEAGVNRPIVHQIRQLFDQGFAHRPASELLALLAHPDHRVRLQAQFELARRGDRSRESLRQVARQETHRFARIHAIWALGQLEDATALAELLADPDAEIRAQSVRALGGLNRESMGGSIREAVVQRISDVDPRVRTFAAIAAGKLKAPQAISPLLSMLADNADRDAYERHAAVMGLIGVASEQQLADLSTHRAGAVRLGALLALRRLHSDQVARFLRDPDRFIAAEAIRAINDEGIDAATPALCKLLEDMIGAEVATTSDELLFRRMLNACLRVGTPSEALLLVQVANADSLPLAYRALALQTLRLLDTPPPIDPTLGTYRPQPTRPKEPIAAAISKPLLAMFRTATGELAAAAILAMDHYRLTLPTEELVARIRDGRQPVEVRQVALKQLVERKQFDQKLLIKSLLSDESPAIRTAAAKSYLLAFPLESESVFQALLKGDTDEDLRAAFQLAAESNDPYAVRLLIDQVDALLREELYRTVRLDLYEAVKKSKEAVVTKKAEELDAYLQRHHLTADDFTREGGDPAQGRRIFQNQGTCLKCHQADQGGGDAGPPLSNIGRLRRSDELLQSIRQPTAVVVPGYGTVTYILDDGTSVTGTPVEQSERSITVRTAVGEQLEVDPQTIEEQTAVTSPMPDMNKVLSRQNVRDLIAYLLSLRGE